VGGRNLPARKKSAGEASVAQGRRKKERREKKMLKREREVETVGHQKSHEGKRTETKSGGNPKQT